MKKGRILICGGRDYEDREQFNLIMEQVRPFFVDEFCLIHGGARGADRLAHVWAFFEGCPVIEMKANWDKYGKSAGPVRNSWMLDYANPDLVIALPGGPGTADMIRRAKAEGIDVYVPL